MLPLIVLTFAGLLAVAAQSHWNECALQEIMDVSKSPGLDDFWNLFVRNDSKLTIDTGADMTSAEIWLEAQGTGWNTDAIERTVDLYARAYRQRAKPRAGKAAAVGESEAAEDDEGDACSGPKIFVYPPPLAAVSSGRDVGDAADGEVTPAKVLRQGVESYTQELMKAPLQCLFGMYGTEILYHNHFLQHSCRTTKPEDADLFFVPSYFKCIEVINFADHFNEGRQGEEEGAVLFAQTMSYVKDFGPWFQRFDGADHIVLFSWGRFPCRLPDWRLSIRSAIALQVEDHCEDLNNEPPTPTFNRWKDVIIPGHIDRWRVVELRKWNLPLSKRDVLIAFHGRHAGNTESYENVTVRSSILELEGLPGVSVGGFVEDYHDLLGHSLFCLAPRGITPWTIHLYVAMLAGCIPVILSDDFELPFQEIIDWPSLSIRWPESKAGKPLYDFLVSRSVDELKSMKAQVDAHACWVDYYSSTPGCSPYEAVDRALVSRYKQRPAYKGRWWPSSG
eukprot:TRINITY_DN21739_c0_g1_i1.p1 TRINITY_DN21739_c0_g1~~TRINITY_DN21739_c0_g1_i1.p1  ORF type:complete len:505 (+),score=88.75 TRINITY_DN21739_c0_g1_i1:82-1596(+)